jgi:hypothetical protein
MMLVWKLSVVWKLCVGSAFRRIEPAKAGSHARGIEPAEAGSHAVLKLSQELFSGR